MEADSIDERGVVDRTGVRRTSAKRLAARLARLTHVTVRDGTERNELDRVDLDGTQANPVALSDGDARLLPQPHGDRDVAGERELPKVRTEVHRREVSQGVSPGGMPREATTSSSGATVS